MHIMEKCISRSQQYRSGVCVPLQFTIILTQFATHFYLVPHSIPSHIHAHTIFETIKCGEYDFISNY